MKINRLTLQRKGESKPRDVEFAPHFNYIHNKKNSTGKSTFVRLLLYALGFAMPNTKKVKFEEFVIEIEIEIDDVKTQVKRKDKKLWINNIEFTLPSDLQIAHATLFQNDSVDLIDNLLGAIYIDQDRGWTLLNRGTVIGGIRFYVEEFLHGMKGKDSDIATKIALRQINDELEKYKQMRALAEYKEQVVEATGERSFERGEVSFDTKTEQFEAARRELLFRKSRLEKEIRLIEAAITDDKKFIERIERYNIFVRTQSGESIPVTRDTIEVYNDNTELNKIEVRRAQISIRKIIEEIATLDSKIGEQPMLFDGETILDHFDKKISDIPIDKGAVERTITSLSKEQMRLREALKVSARTQNEWVNKLNEYIKNYATELNVNEYLKDGEGVFTRELKSISGAIYHKLVFVFRISYALVLSEKLGYKMPLFIDSPNGREVEQDAINYMIGMLERDFVGHQIFLASIFDFIKKEDCNKVIHLDGKFFDVISGQISMWDNIAMKIDETDDKK